MTNVLKGELLMKRNYITAAIVLVLFVSAFGYSKGWFSPSSDSVSADQSLDSYIAEANAVIGAETSGQATGPAAE